MGLFLDGHLVQKEKKKEKENIFCAGCDEQSEEPVAEDSDTTHELPKKVTRTEFFL
jgi:hypothetical protein